MPYFSRNVFSPCDVILTGTDVDIFEDGASIGDVDFSSGQWNDKDSLIATDIDPDQLEDLILKCKRNDNEVGDLYMVLIIKSSPYDEG